VASLPDLGQGSWWIVHDHWKSNPAIAKGMPLLSDGCRFRLGGAGNAGPDGNGRIEWQGDDLVFFVDNRPEQRRVFKRQDDGSYQEGQHPNAWKITWVGSGAVPQKAAADKCASS
jgi:hypothetical protein